MNEDNQLTSKYDRHSIDNPYGITTIYNNSIRIGCAFNTSYILTEDNILLTCGGSSFGKLGRPTINSGLLRPIDADINIDRFNCGSFFVGSITLDNNIYMFGDNSTGQLGINSHHRKVTIPSKASLNTNNDHIIDVKCGSAHTIIKTDKTFYVCGDNSHKQLLIPNNDNIYKPTIIDVEYIKKHTKLDTNIIDLIPTFKSTLILQKKG